MTKQCKCEHWEQCPVCMPHRFNDDGELLPIPLTPLQQAREDVAGLRMALAQSETMIERLQSQIDRAVILLRDIAAEPCDYDMEKQPAIYCANKFLAELDGKEWPTLETPNAGGNSAGTALSCQSVLNDGLGVG